MLDAKRGSGTEADIRTRHGAAQLALLATVGLTGFKLGVAYISGSVGLFSEGIHSFLDLVSAIVAYFSIREAGKPADEDHPFGHGKIETLSSLFESMLLIVAAALIVYEGWDHWRYPRPVEHQVIAIATMALSIVVSYLVYRHNAEAARKAESRALRVNALHFLTDVMASAGVLGGLILLRITGWLWLDAGMAFAVAAYILIVTLHQVKGALFELTDVQLPEDEVRGIHEAIASVTQKPAVIESHDLRTRRSGATRHIDFHLVVCGWLTVGESHAICDEIEGAIERQLPGSSVTIHVEPCEHARLDCQPNCALYRERAHSGNHL